MTTVNFGLPLVEAARRSGVTVNTTALPKDGHVISEGLKLHYFDWDPGPSATQSRLPVLCLHGFAQNAHMWDFTALAVAHRRRVIALDQRGHGDSDWSSSRDYGVEPMQGDIANVVKALRLDRFIMLGLSMGGRNSFTYTAAHPDQVKALAVVDVGPEGNRAGAERIRNFTSRDDVLPSFESFVERTMSYVPFREEWMVRGSLHNNLRQLPDGRWTWKYDPYLRGPNRRMAPQPGGVEEAWRQWRSIACPTLLVRGAESDILPADVARRMVEALPGRAQFAEVPKAGHLVPGDNPAGFERAFLPFLNKVDG